MIDHDLSFTEETLKIFQETLKFQIVEYNLPLIAHNGFGFDSYVVLNNLPQW